MGILSEIDMMNRDAEDDAFEVSSDSETVDSEAYHTGDIVSSEDGYYPSSFYLYVDSAEENGITVTGGTLSAPVEETEGGTKYLVTNNSGGSIVISG